jgi:hypothetical protein
MFFWKLLAFAWYNGGGKGMFSCFFFFQCREAAHKRAASLFYFILLFESGFTVLSKKFL